jgi:hypothetical protein
MWNGKMNLTLQNGAHCTFKMWHHFTSDDGSAEWKPETNAHNEYLLAWRLESISISLILSEQIGDANQHIVIMGNHIYVSQKGFQSENTRVQIINSLKDSTYNRDDVWQLF